MRDGSAVLAGGEIGIMVIEEESSNTIFSKQAFDTKYTSDTNKTVAQIDANNALVYGTGSEITFTANNTVIGSENVTFKLVKYNAANSVWNDYVIPKTTKTNYTPTGAFSTSLTATENKRFAS